MSITFFKPADSFSVFNKKSHPALAECTNAAENLQKKINKVANTLKGYATEHNIIKYNADSGETTLFNGQIIKDSPQSLKLVADVLMSTGRFNNELKEPSFIREISRLTKSLDKYSKQAEKIEKKDLQAKLRTLREIVAAENKLDNMKLNSGLPEVVKTQKTDSKQEIAKISETRKLLGQDMTPECFSARKNMGILIEYFNANSGTFKEKGLFRTPGSKREIETITEYMNTGIKTKEKIFKYLNEFKDIHCITGTFKEYLKLTLTTDDKKTIQRLVEGHAKSPQKAPLLKQLPSPIQELLPFLAKIERNNKTNLMTADNLARVFAPHFQQNSTEIDGIKQLKELTESYIPYISHLISYKSNHPAPVPLPRFSKLK